ncbi:MAG: phytanoyl-CoA dioxygenase family protein [Nostoc sp. LLA-1]|nr:phytanoyl-CoA dioxygenase family protein [Cyanocohniella sp. LLY]
MKSIYYQGTNFLQMRKKLRELNLRLQIHYHYTIINPQWTLISTLSRFIFFRNLVKKLSKIPELNHYDLNKSLFQEIDVEQAVNSLNKYGCYLGIKLPKIISQEIIMFALSTDCYGNLDSKCGFLYSQKKQAEEKNKAPFSIATYFNVDILCPVIKRLSNDPAIRMIAAKYMKTEPIFTDARLWWTFPVDEINYDAGKTASFFHYDQDDYSCLRFFFYLTDVDLQSGPHICIRGSHTKKKITQIISLTQRKDQEVLDYYNHEDVLTICGEAGSGFIEDPYCFHKATRPILKDRLVLQLRFASRDYGVLKSSADPSLLKNIFTHNQVREYFNVA